MEERLMSGNKLLFIRVQGQLVPVTEQVYREHHKMKRRAIYLEERDEARGKVLYSDMDTDELTGEDMIPDCSAESIEDTISRRLMAEKLRAAIEVLLDDERMLIEMIYYSNGGKGMTQREASERLGISQPAIKKRHDKIISKFRILIKI
jgi:RNA polymerase sigma factor (sigma-70 family)